MTKYLIIVKGQVKIIIDSSIKNMEANIYDMIANTKI